MKHWKGSCVLATQNAFRERSVFFSQVILSMAHWFLVGSGSAEFFLQEIRYLFMRFSTISLALIIQIREANASFSFCTVLYNRRMRLSVIIPAYNEEQRLPGTLRAVHDYLQRQSYESEVIVVNGGSRDRTGDIVREQIPVMSRLRLVETENKGKGYAVKRGMLASYGDIRLFTDADNSTSIEQVEKMFPWFDKGYGMVIGSRDVEGAVLNPPQPWLRHMLTAESFKLLRKILVGLWDIEDSQCGFKAFSAKAAEAIFPKSVIERFAFDPEVLFLARKYGYKIKEIPVTWVNDIHSKVNMMSMVKMGIDLFLIRAHIITGTYEK